MNCPECEIGNLKLIGGDWHECDRCGFAAHGAMVFKPAETVVCPGCGAISRGGPMVHAYKCKTPYFGVMPDLPNAKPEGDCPIRSALYCLPVEADAKMRPALARLRDMEDAINYGEKVCASLVKERDAILAKDAEAFAQKNALIEKLEKDCMAILEQRDHAEEWADRLALAIAVHMDEDPGEHSNLNNPWANALNLITGTRCR